MRIYVRQRVGGRDASEIERASSTIGMKKSVVATTAWVSLS